MKAFKGGAISAAKGGGRMVHIATLLNHIFEEALAVDNVYLTTEEGYLTVEEDNKSNIIISEDLV